MKAALCLVAQGFHTWTLQSATGLFYFANKLKSFGIKYRFIGNLFDVDNTEILCLSYMLRYGKTIIKTTAKKIILGGAGADIAPVETNVPILRVYGAASGLTLENIKKEDGMINITDQESEDFPLIPNVFLDSLFPYSIPYFNGKGCHWQKCLFCERPKYNVKNPFIVAKDVVRIFQTYNRKVMLSLDGPSKQYCIELANELIKLRIKGEKAKWGISLSAKDAKDSVFVDYLVEAGCVSVGMGIEYLEDTVLRTIQKGFDSQEALKAIKNVAKHNIYIHLCFINFDPYIKPEMARTHHNNFDSIMKNKYIKNISFSWNELRTNPILDTELKKIKE